MIALPRFTSPRHLGLIGVRVVFHARDDHRNQIRDPAPSPSPKPSPWPFIGQTCRFPDIAGNHRRRSSCSASAFFDWDSWSSASTPSPPVRIHFRLHFSPSCSAICSQGVRGFTRLSPCCIALSGLVHRFCHLAAFAASGRLSGCNWFSFCCSLGGLIPACRSRRACFDLTLQILSSVCSWASDRLLHRLTASAPLAS